MMTETATKTYGILLVEDDAPVRDMIAQHLRRNRYEVVAHESAEEVLAGVRRGDLAYDMVLLDVHLPGMSGLDLARLLMATAPLKPVILITGDDDEAMARRALEQGATAYLLKPFELFELDATVSQATSMIQLVETTEVLARAQAAQGSEWGEPGGDLPRSWLHLCDARSTAGDGHGSRVVSIAGTLANGLGERLDRTDRDALRIAARTHELGRLLGASTSVPEVASRSAQLLRDLDFDGRVIEAVRHMPERWDGAGQPDALAEDGIPILSRLLALADWVDHEAVAADRTGGDPQAAIAGVLDRAGTEEAGRFDPELVRRLGEDREGLVSMWVLQRRGTGT